MTDRYNALTVVLEQEARDDDLESLVGAIRMLRHVIQVVPAVEESGLSVFIAKAQEHLDIKRKLYDFIQNELK